MQEISKKVPFRYGDIRVQQSNGHCGKVIPEMARSATGAEESTPRYQYFKIADEKGVARDS